MLIEMRTPGGGMTKSCAASIWGCRRAAANGVIPRLAAGYNPASRFSRDGALHMRRAAKLVLALALVAAALADRPTALADDTPAKQLFASKPLPADMRAQPIGFYSKGCLAGGVAIPVDGPDWQVMRLSRNRRWGHPDLLRIVEDLSVKARREGWNGLMIGDMSQPRGGPMLTGHASHQIGLDADIWFLPMPDKRLTYQEREDLSAVSMLKPGSVYVDDRRWTPAHERLLRAAASYKEVERILVHPGIKKKLCDTVKGERAWLAKIRPYYGHEYHFHLRIGCPHGASDCKDQAEVPAGEGCDKSLAWWFEDALKPKKTAKPDPDKKPAKPRFLKLADLPKPCATVLEAKAVTPEEAEFPVREQAFTAPEIEIPQVDPAAILASKPIEASKAAPAAAEPAPLEDVAVPTPRPADLGE